MKKHNKIMVVVCPDDNTRTKLLQRLTVKLGFAQTPSDAGKIIRQSPHDYDLNTAYFVLALSYNMRISPITTQRLYEMAAHGIAVVVGMRRLPQEYEFLCERYDETNI